MSISWALAWPWHLDLVARDITSRAACVRGRHGRRCATRGGPAHERLAHLARSLEAAAGVRAARLLVRWAACARPCRRARVVGARPRLDAGAPLSVLALFFVVSVGIYLLNAVYPGRIATLYRVALIFDLGVVFVLVRITGGYASDLYLAFILLIALHAFYFGLATGLAAAAAAIGLYALSGDWPPPMPGVALRMGSFVLVGLCMGVVSEQARHQRETVEQQHERLMRSDRLATVGELAAGLAHELRNPLAGIGGALHVLGSQLPQGDGTRALLTDV